MRNFIIVLAFCFWIAGTADYAAAAKDGYMDWEIGTEIFSMEYKEPGIMKNEGMMSGVIASFTNYDDYRWLKAEARLAFGQVDYESNDTGSQNDIDDSMFEVRAMMGYDIMNSEYGMYESDISFIPYFGIAYRYLNDDSSGKVTTTGAAGYERESNYFYSPVGFELIKYFEADDSGAWSVGLTFEYDIFWRGKQVSHLSDVDPAFSDPSNRQDDGYGLRGSVKLSRKSKALNFSFEPFIRYWHVSQSEDQNVFYGGTIWGYGYEPKNETTEIGVKLALIF